MMPGPRLREERRKERTRVGIFIVLSAVVVVTVLLQPGYAWVSLAVGASGAIAVAVGGDLPGGRGRVDPGKERRKQRGRAGGFIGCGAVIVSGLLQPDWQWVPLAVGASAGIAVAAGVGLPGGRGRGSGLSGRGRDDDDGPADAAAHRWHMLVMVSRVMPGSTGRRWLAEAESLLSEIAPARRGAAVRSYLMSAPQVVRRLGRFFGWLWESSPGVDRTELHLSSN